VDEAPIISISNDEDDAPIISSSYKAADNAHGVDDEGPTISADGDGNEFVSNNEDEAPIVSGYEAADRIESIGNDVDEAPSIASGYEAADDACDVDKALLISENGEDGGIESVSAYEAADNAHDDVWTRLPSSAAKIKMTEMNPSIAQECWRTATFRKLQEWPTQLDREHRSGGW
jgi:hypothetical protein